jgi:hypothetical protein
MKQQQRAEAVLRAAIVPYTNTEDEEDIKDNEINNSDNDGFLGWDNDDNGDRFEGMLE